MAINERRAQEAECKRILSSGIFSPRSHPARFLEHVCASYFEGKSAVSERDIAVGAFGRRPDFDPQQDAIVRVEASRVRKRLSEYYENEGAGHDLMLMIPMGSYLPTFVPRMTDMEGGRPSTLTPSRRGSVLLLWKRVAFLAPLVLIAVTAAIWMRGRHSSAVRTLPTPNRPPAVESTRPPAEVRIMAGSSATEYTDSLGHPWSPDRYFRGGEAFAAPFRKISRTRNPQLFLTCRQGRDFSYHIPLQGGTYELRLYFSEASYGEDNPQGGGESSRMFDISANNVPLVTDFDPLSDAGGDNTADVRVFKGISPAPDGELHLRFNTIYVPQAAAFVNAIAIDPVESNSMLPIRWVTSDSALVDSFNHVWHPDEFSLGGRIRAHSEPVADATQPELFRSERYGHFSYAIPVANGTYTVTLYFSEDWFGLSEGDGSTRVAGVGRRVFDVWCNGVTLLRNFDIAKEAGGPKKGIRETFHGLKPNAQGKLLFTFVPVKDYACLNAIEVVDEGSTVRNH
jgi:hypothetical protein